MDPNANLTEQEQLLRQLQAKAAAGRSERTLRAMQRQLSEYRQALYDWLRDGGFEPDWSRAPEARKYYGR